MQSCLAPCLLWHILVKWNWCCFCADEVAAVKIQKHYTNWIHLGNIPGKPILHSSTDEGSRAPPALHFPRHLSFPWDHPRMSLPVQPFRTQSVLPPQHMGCAVPSLNAMEKTQRNFSLLNHHDACRYWQACDHLGVCPHPCFSWDQKNVSEVNFPVTVFVPAANRQLWGQAGAWLE